MIYNWRSEIFVILVRKKLILTKKVKHFDYFVF